MKRKKKHFNLATNKAYPTSNGYPLWIHIDYKRQCKSYIRKIGGISDYLQYILKRCI